MTINESDRRAIFVGLEPILGAEATDKLMSLLPAQPASQLVTREDLRVEMSGLRTELRGEMSELRAELRGEMSELRGEFAQLRGEFAELKGEFGELKGEFAGLRGEYAAQGGHFTSELAKLRVSTQRWMTSVVAANAVTVITVLVA